MVKDIEKIISPYALEMAEEVKDTNSRFVTLKEIESDPSLEVVLQYVKDELYSVRFLNNEFFEIPTPELLAALKGILEGNYEIQDSLFKRNKSVKVIAQNQYLLPERIYKAKDFKGEYASLPRSFDKRRSPN